MALNKIQELTRKIKKFSTDRDWEQYNTPKNVAISVVLEAAELLEHFQWKEREGLEKYIEDHKEDIGEEIADVAIYLFYLTQSLGLDLSEIIEDKLKKNARKYPISKCKGRSEKYSELL